MPPLSPELQLLLTRLIGEVDRLRGLVEGEHYITEEYFQEKLMSMNEDIAELKHDFKQMREVDLKALQEALMKNQSEGQARTIKVLVLLLTAFCLPILAAIVIYIIQTFLQHAPAVSAFMGALI